MPTLPSEVPVTVNVPFVCPPGITTIVGLNVTAPGIWPESVSLIETIVTFVPVGGAGALSVIVPPTVWFKPTTETLLSKLTDIVGVVTFTATDTG